MEGTLDSFDFILAESLHMTVQQIHNDMSNLEYVQWRAFYNYRAAMQDFEAKKQQGK